MGRLSGHFYWREVIAYENQNKGVSFEKRSRHMYLLKNMQFVSYVDVCHVVTERSSYSVSAWCKQTVNKDTTLCVVVAYKRLKAMRNYKSG